MVDHELRMYMLVHGSTNMYIDVYIDTRLYYLYECITVKPKGVAKIPPF